MCEVCENTIIQVNLNRYDPTKTTALRNRAVSESNRRFNELAKAIKEAIITKDVFGLQLQVNLELPDMRAFAFGTDAEKLKAFLDWLEEQVNKGLLNIADFEIEGISDSWINKYVKTAYERGIVRARLEMIKAGYDVQPIDATGGISTAFSLPVHIETLALLYMRTFNDLKGITSQMDAQISRILAQGLADGVNVATLVRRLLTAINGTGKDLAIRDATGRITMSAKRRAEILIRTELARAHHLATINEYRLQGIAGVNIRAEWKTVGDDRVCEKCASLEGKVFTLDEIEPLIPLHPQCRCIALPLVIKNK